MEGQQRYMVADGYALISLIIPVYNVEKYFAKCMESVLAQTYPNFEAILVDDGSTDSSGKMCDEYAAKDERITAYHKPNGGLSDARNYGVARSRGEYIVFLDSDDYVETFYLAYLYEILTRFDADMACASTTTVYESAEKDNKTVPVQQVPPNERCLTTTKALEEICYTSVGAPDKIYKREFVVKHPYPVTRLYEDLATTYKIVGDCQKVAFSDKRVSFWVQRSTSILHGAIDERQYDIFWAANGLTEYIRKNYPEAMQAAAARNMMVCIDFLKRLLWYSDDDLKKHFKRVREFAKPYIKTTLSNKHVTRKTRIATLAILTGYVPTRMIWWLQRILQAKKEN